MQKIIQQLKNNITLNISLTSLLFSLILAVGFFISAHGFSKQGSYVEVKGLSEKIVKADTAIWSLAFEVKSNDIDTLYADTEKSISTITSFLISKGFEKNEINVAPINIYQDTYRDASFRYNATNQVSVYTTKVDLVKSAANETLSLIKDGVVLNQNYTTFEFSDLNSIKPDMLAESIKNARDTAKQLAQNAGAGVGRVTRGNQGVFDISDKDPASPEYKKIRLVSTLRFLLK